MNTDRIRDIKDQLETLQANKIRKQKEIDNFEIDPDYFSDEYDTGLNESYPEFMGTYQPAYTLKKVDLIAYDEGLANYVDSLDKDRHPDYKELVEELEDIDSEIYDLETELDELENEGK